MPSKGDSLETKHEIWNADHGTRIEVGPDRDGLDRVEIRCVDEKGKIGERITMEKAQAALVAQALLKVAGEQPSV